MEDFSRNRKLVWTEDGSPSIAVPPHNVTFHNMYGALPESRIIYIQNGLQCVSETRSAINVFEMGLGTGLNAVLSWEFAKNNNKSLQYTAVELFPLEKKLWQLYMESPAFSCNQKKMFCKIHRAEWNKTVCLDTQFELMKQQASFMDVDIAGTFNLVYFDAFYPATQPELWTESSLVKIFNLLKNNGIMVNYSGKGSVRRLLEAIGFLVEKLPGPPGKREVTRARKKN